MGRLSKLISLQWAFFRASLIADLEFRLNASIQAFNDVLWYLMQIIAFEAIYAQVAHLGTWGLVELRVFLGVLFTVDALYMVFFSRNIYEFSQKVTRGDLDLLLAKPVNSQYLMSCQRMNTTFIFNFVLALCWLFWSLNKLEGGMPWGSLPFLIVLIPMGLLIQYSCSFSFSALSLFTVRSEGMLQLSQMTFRLGMRPDNLYMPWVRYLVLLVIPTGLIASVPTRLLLGPFDPALLAWMVIATVGFLWISSLIWRRGLRFYASAST